MSFFISCYFGLVIFRAQSFDQVTHMLQAVLFNFRIHEQDDSSWLKLAAFISPLLIVQAWQYRSNDLMILYKQHWVLKTVIYAVMTGLILGWGIMKAEEFIYFQF